MSEKLLETEGLVIYKEWLEKHAHQRFSSIYNQMKWWSDVVGKINETYITPICGGKVDMMERWLGPTHITLNELISIQGWVFDQTLSLVIKLCVWWSFFFFSFLIFGLLRRTDDQTLSVTSLIYTLDSFFYQLYIWQLEQIQDSSNFKPRPLITGNPAVYAES